MAGANVETVAKAMNITPRRVQQLAGEGMPRAVRGEYDLGQCMAWYIRYLQKIVESRSQEGDRTGIAEWTKERSRLAKEQADRTALQNAELRGDLGRISVWKEEVTNVFIEIRAALLAVPSKLAPVLDGDVNDRQRILEASAHEILDHLASYRPTRRTAKHPQGDNGEAGGTSTAAEIDDQPVGRRKAKAKQRVVGRTRPMAN